MISIKFPFLKCTTNTEQKKWKNKSFYIPYISLTFFHHLMIIHKYSPVWQKYLCETLRRSFEEEIVCMIFLKLFRCSFQVGNDVGLSRRKWRMVGDRFFDTHRGILNNQSKAIEGKNLNIAAFAIWLPSFPSILSN